MQLLGLCPAQFQPQEPAEQVVVAEPGAVGVERDDEGVRVLQFQKDPLRPGRTGEQVRELAVDSVQHGGAQEQSLDVLGLPLQHLSHQILGHRAVAA